MYKLRVSEEIKLFLFSIFVSVLSYGFTLTNYSLTVDSESPIFPDYSMGLGRWGTNLIRYKLFEGLLPYFTLLIGLFFLSLAAVEFTKIFRLRGVYAMVFCALFLTLPQHAYQLAFTMQADAVPIGFFCAALAVNLFINNMGNFKTISNISKLVLSCLLIVFSISIYQALVMIPVVTFLIYFFINTFNNNYKAKDAFIELGFFAVLMIVSGILYYISVKIICPPVEGGYLSSYTSGNSNNRFIDFYNLLVDNFRGDFYYGDKTYLLASVSCLFLLIFFVRKKDNFLLKSISLLGIMVIPFFISFFITNGAHPPRLYVASPIAFGFLLTFVIKFIKKDYSKQILFFVLLVVLNNIYFITNLFYSNYKIFNHDLNIAKEINRTIEQKYPEFNPNMNYVYFHGSLPESNYIKLQIPNTDVFSGSLFRWDGGNNWRIINFFRANDIAYYKFLDDKESYNKIKDSIQAMPVWPNTESIKKIENVVIVKISDTPGAPLPFQ